MRHEKQALRHFETGIGEGIYASFAQGVGEGILALLPGDEMEKPSIPLVDRYEGFEVTGRLRIPGGGSFCGASVDGHIVSWAATGGERHGARFITVETEIAFRGRGLAAQAIRGICEREKGLLIYLCESGNLPSIRAAQKAGLQVLGTVQFKEK